MANLKPLAHSLPLLAFFVLLAAMLVVGTTWLVQSQSLQAPKIDGSNSAPEGSDRDGWSGRLGTLATKVAEQEREIERIKAAGSATAQAEVVLRSTRAYLDDVSATNAARVEELRKQLGELEALQVKRFDALAQLVDGAHAPGAPGAGAPTTDASLVRRLVALEGSVNDVATLCAQHQERLADLRARLAGLAPPGSRMTLDQLPVGTILAWDSRLRDPQGRLLGGSRDVPDGWALCDGRNGDLPDLKGRFLLGAGAREDLGKTGGRSDIPDGEAHWHHSSSPPAIKQALIAVKGAPHPDPNTYYFSANGHQHDHGGVNLPPYVTVHYIIKLR